MQRVRVRVSGVVLCFDFSPVFVVRFRRLYVSSLDFWLHGRFVFRCFVDCSIFYLLFFLPQMHGNYVAGRGTDR